MLRFKIVGVCVFLMWILIMSVFKLYFRERASSGILESFVYKFRTEQCKRANICLSFRSGSRLSNVRM